MKKKLIALSVAAVLSVSSVMSASAATWADVLKNINTDRKIDVGADIEQRRNGTSDAYADGTINVEVSSADEEKSFDYKATLYMKNVQETFRDYYSKALLLCTGDAALKTELDNMPVRGEFNIEVEFPSTMTIPTDMVNTLGEMKGFNEEAKKIFEGLSKHSDLVFNQAKMVVDKMSAFDQNQILDGLYQDMVSDDRYVKEKVSFFLQWGALNEQLQENTIKYCTDLLAQKIQISQIPYFEGFYTQCKNKAAMKTILERWKDENTTLKTVIEGIL